MKHQHTTYTYSKQTIVMLVALLFLLLAAIVASIYLLPAQAQPVPVNEQVDLLSPQTFHNGLSLGAVMVGALTAFLLQMAFNLIGISLNILKPHSAQTKNQTDTLMAVSWLIASTVIAACIGGYITAYSANLPHLLDSLLHTGLVWIVSLMVTVTSIFIASEMPQLMNYLAVSRQYSR